MYAWVAGSSSASRSPWATSSATHMIAGPPASETTATRSPCGIGCKAKAIARSKSSSIEFARRTPVCENTASAARSEPPREPVWDTAARLPASERPDFTAMTGLSFVVSRAIRTKFLGLPKFSMYARISFVSGSPCHTRRRSLRLTWALFPSEQNFAKPTPKDFAWSKMAMPRAPLCVASEIPSVGNLEDARVRADPMDARRLRIHRVDRPLVLVHNEVVEDFVPDFSTMTRCADDCDGRRREDRVESAAGHRGANPRRGLKVLASSDSRLLSGSQVAITRDNGAI